MIGRISGFAATMILLSASAIVAQERTKSSGVAATRSQSATSTQKTATLPQNDSAMVPTETTSSIAAVGGNSWRVECTGDGKVLDCRLVQQVLLRENQQLVIGLTVRFPSETKKPVMMIQMPLGILVSEAVVFRVDEGKPESFNIQTCNQQGCFVGTPLAETMIAAMRAGKQIQIVFHNANKQAITVTMPLNGFGLAFDKVKG